ncbi:glycoside hydrolase family 10 protein [Thermoflavimicrobium dichotomicum]|uniref:Uncharacterized lipoprotein YddW, UPF0748 family n=1 Tax=Thermoflavimicrobium dichotomicum TaxID=46223 RepID=A0A1I3NX67_9BACL|nr:family 10 glycosylhydrolase [Thermoflavimicrobium dichotomicum]SFJ13874.1 Uncharacterized lipoprotein YddW, UPF0748 family [Thermoflavimicrobium dichotomicum]
MGGNHAGTKREWRAAWIATVENLDWPSNTGLSKDRQQSEMIRLFDELVSIRMNAVMVQIRPTADAFYPSQINPWSKYLMGDQGKDPGYDPLAFMLQEAHQRNLEFHAWFNPYRVSMNTDRNQLASDHPGRKYPNWVKQYGQKLYYDPGIPQVMDHIVESVMEVVSHYDIDAVHLDDYFYPYPINGQDFPDQDTYQKYGAGQFPSKAEWRRHNVNQLVERLAKAIKQKKPHVKFGISPFGIWRNRSSDPNGSDTSGLESYDDLYVDSRKWIQQKWLDYIIPQIYWNIGHQSAAYEKLADWWSQQVKNNGHHLYMGHALYKVGKDNQAWNQPDEIPNQLELNRSCSEIKGSSFFSVRDVVNNPLGVSDQIKNEYFKFIALVPIMPWLNRAAPKAPVLQSLTPKGDRVEIRWQDTDPGNTAYFVLYRFVDDEPVSIDKPQNIWATIRKSNDPEHVYVDTAISANHAYTYAVTAVERLHHESSPSRSLTIRL